MDKTRISAAFLNLGHALDHLMMLIFPTVILAMTAEFGRDYRSMLPLALGGFVAFGAGSLPAGWLGDRWGRRPMMILFFTGIGGAAILTGFAQSPWQIAAGLTLVGLFASIYHPVGIAMLVKDKVKMGSALGWNGLCGNLGVAFAALSRGGARPIRRLARGVLRSRITGDCRGTGLCIAGAFGAGAGLDRRWRQRPHRA